MERFVPRQNTDTVANGCVRRALHRGTASLFARLPKCANNAIRLMLFAQYGGSNLSLGEMWDKAGNVERDSFSPTKRFNFFEDKINQRNSGVIEVKGIQWDKRQLPPGGSFKPVVVRNPRPHPALCLGLLTARSRANANRGDNPPNRG
jgi:hypothetical protein